MANLLQALNQMNQAFRVIQESLFHVNMFFWNIFGIKDKVAVDPLVTLLVIAIIAYVVSNSPMAKDFFGSLFGDVKRSVDSNGNIRTGRQRQHQHQN